MSTYFKLSDYWDYFFENDYMDLFKNDLSQKRMCELFNIFVLNINIETSSFCNRKCNYCPLSYIDRKQILMSDEVWEKCISELQEIGYKGRITFALFNEPLLDVTFPQKIEYVRKNLPDTLIACYSNGDYLTWDKLNEIENSGLDWLLVTRHINGEEFSREKCKIQLEEYIHELGLDDYVISYREMNDNNCSFALKYRNLELYIVVNNWNVTGVNRGGKVESLNTPQIRSLPCAKAIRDFCISYDGKIKPCCNIYFDEEANFGTIENDGILNAYFHNLRDFRLDMVKFGEKTGGCMYCGEPDTAKIETKDIRESIDFMGGGYGTSVIGLQ